MCISESIETLQSTTDTLKPTLDQKTCQIVNKTTAIFEKAKSHNEELKTFSKPNPQGQQNIQKPVKDSTQETVTKQSVNISQRKNTKLKNNSKFDKRAN